MTKQKIRKALAFELGFKPVKTVPHKLLVISVPVLLWGPLFLLPLVVYHFHLPAIRFFYLLIIGNAFGVLFLANAFKHRISYTAPSIINTAIAATCNRPSLTVENAKTQLNRETAGSTGLTNALQRPDVHIPAGPYCIPLRMITCILLI